MELYNFQQLDSFLFVAFEFVSSYYHQDDRRTIISI